MPTRSNKNVCLSIFETQYLGVKIPQGFPLNVVKIPHFCVFLLLFICYIGHALPAEQAVHDQNLNVQYVKTTNTRQV
jgi:hypothetical protein